jgi:predicted phage-related endonuclease
MTITHTACRAERIAKPSHGSQEWLRLRWRDADGRCTFGASDAPALMGASPYTSRADLYFDKRVEPVMEEEKPVFRRGNVLEPALLEEAAHLLGTPIATPQVMYRLGRFTVSMDGVDDVERPTLAVEAKTSSRYAVQSADDLPMEWRWQGWAQQAVLGVPVHFIVLDRDLRITMVELPRHDEAIASLWAEAETFGAMVDAGTPADAEINQFSADQIARLWPATPEPVALPEEARGVLADLRAARAARRDAETREAEARDAIARMLLGHEVGLLDGERAVTWRTQAGRVTLDARRLREEQPELFERFATRGEPYRVLRVA